MKDKCQTILTRPRITLGGHKFIKHGENYRCEKCPLEIDQVFMDQLVRKQNQN